MLIKNALNIYNTQGIRIINPNNTGNNTVQQKDINWSNLILGNEALTHIKIKTIIELFNPITIPYSILFKLGLFNKDFILSDFNLGENPLSVFFSYQSAYFKTL